MLGKTLVLTAVVTLAVTLVAPIDSTGAGPQTFSVTKTFTSAHCPTGWSLTGGGAGPLPASSNTGTFMKEYTLTGSYPSAAGWVATGTLTSGYLSKGPTVQWVLTTSAYQPRVYVVCAK